MRDFDLPWQRKQYEGGWAGVSWPQEYRRPGTVLDPSVDLGMSGIRLGRMLRTIICALWR